MSERRRLVEREGRRHAVRRGMRGTLHFENMPRLHKVLEFLLRVTLTKDRGVRNVLDVRTEEVEIVLGNLPAGFVAKSYITKFIMDIHTTTRYT